MSGFQAIPTRAVGPPADLATACGRGRRSFSGLDHCLDAIPDLSMTRGGTASG
ncbi:MAG: hypothetical protein ACLQVJ_11860 [Syntrophobacteraceae bacterium]